MPKNRILSFKYAIEGLVTAFKDEPNLKIHVFLGLIALIFGVLFQISDGEWLAILIVIGLVISIELTNTSIEELSDSFTKENHPSAKKAKDVAAGAVLIASITALITGVVIFIPHFKNLW